MNARRSLHATWVSAAIIGLCAVTPAAAQEQVTLSGAVVAKNDGTPQTGAFVAIVETGATTLTDASGRYSFTVAPGTYTVRVQAVGYLDIEQTAVVSAGNPAIVDFPVEEDPRFSEVIVVVGSRTQRTQLETPVPVDVISSDTISKSSHTETNQLLNTIAPSFSAARQTIADGTDHIDPASLRGLGPDQVLVLVNGKRRHSSALVNLFATPGRGTVGVDLNAIPTGAIARIEVLRDGAASQYGSDAIAGVINIVLKDYVGVLDMDSLAGITASGDGEQLKLGANDGFKLGEGGFFNLTGSFLARGRTNRTEPWPEDIFPGIEGPEATQAELDQRGTTRRDYTMEVGQSGALVGTLFLNAMYPLSEGIEAYAFGGYTYRKGYASGFYRLPNSADRVDLDIYPDGFLPQINPLLQDWSVSAGMRTRTDRWSTDFSVTHGGNSFHFFVDNSINASLGAASPRSFDAGELSFAHTTANMDFTHDLAVSALESLAVVFGGEYRHESFDIVAGQPESYEQGPEVTESGELKAPGSQVFPGYQPTNEVAAIRQSQAAYVGIESQPIERLNLDLGGRFEHYSDFGNTVIGKAAARFSLLKSKEQEVAVRGAVSTGFRAPSLHQVWFSTITTDFINDPVTGALTPREIITSNNHDPITEAFGIPKLTEETSVNLSGGVTTRLMKNLSLSADFYRISITDRIVLSGFFGTGNEQIGDEVAMILQDFPAVEEAQFFVNAADTTTNGVDLVVDYTHSIGAGMLAVTASATFTDTTVANIRIPDSVATRFAAASLDTVSDLILGRDEENRLEDILPRQKGSLGLGYSLAALSANLRATYFGGYVFRSPDARDEDGIPGPDRDESFGPEVIFDLDVGYRIGNLRLGVGGNNIFNNFPDKQKHPDNIAGNRFIYGPSPFGIDGAFYYVRMQYLL